jgi:hypothetical protein
MNYPQQEIFSGRERAARHRSSDQRSLQALAGRLGYTQSAGQQAQLSRSTPRLPRGLTASTAGSISHFSLQATPDLHAGRATGYSYQ